MKLNFTVSGRIIKLKSVNWNSQNASLAGFRKSKILQLLLST